VNFLLRGHGEAAFAGWPTSPPLETMREEWLAAPDLGAQKAVADRIQQQAFVDCPTFHSASSSSPPPGGAASRAC